VVEGREPGALIAKHSDTASTPSCVTYARGTILALMHVWVTGLVVAIVLCVFGVVGALGHSLSARSKVGAVRFGDCRKARASHPRVEHLSRPPQTVSRRAQLAAVVKTNCGQFRIKLDAHRFPVVVNSFVYLARSGFYDGLQFNRVVPHFVIQGGDPLGNGMSGPGYRVIDPPPADFRYRDGTVAMSKSSSEARGQAGSTFFVVTGGGASIAPEYAVLGRLRAGMGTVRRISSLGTAREIPRQVVRIDWIRIRRR
jgi:cyclophilin family peptidyl-prolyl cis-trans isomerase